MRAFVCVLMCLYVCGVRSYMAQNKYHTPLGGRTGYRDETHIKLFDSWLENDAARSPMVLSGREIEGISTRVRRIYETANGMSGFAL